MQLKRQSIRTAIAWLALSGLLFVVNPNHLPVVILVLPFILMYLALYELWLLLVVIWQQFSAKPRAEADIRQSGKFLSLFISFIAILGSLGQLVARDVITITLLFVIGYFYLVRGRKHKRSN